jgi:DNA-binding MarR family transcriptional regulator
LPDTLEFMQLLWALVHALERTSKKMAGSVGVTGPQRLVLRVVGLYPRVSAGELAAILHVHPSTLTGVLERLVGQRLLTRISDPGDRRRAILSLTAKGVRVNEARHATAESAVYEALVGVRSGDRAATIRVLQRLTVHLERGVQAPAPALRRAPRSTRG